jgi:hypothetical protein
VDVKAPKRRNRFKGGKPPWGYAAPGPPRPARAPRAPKAPEEHDEQVQVFKHLDREYGEGILAYAVPNGGKRDPVTGKRLKDEGVKPGVPDICLAEPRGGYHGLYIEMKRTVKGKVSPEQKIWISELRIRGYRVEVCRGAETAIAVIEEYLKC